MFKTECPRQTPGHSSRPSTLGRHPQQQSLLLLWEPQAKGCLGCCLLLTHSSLLAYPSHSALWLPRSPARLPAQLGDIKNLAPLSPGSAPLGPSLTTVVILMSSDADGVLGASGERLD